MRKARITVAHTKNNLSRYLAYVRRGGRVTILNRDTPVAELIPVDAGGSRGAGSLEAHLRRLEREGVLHLGSGRVPREMFKPPRGKRGRVLEALLEERASGR